MNSDGIFSRFGRRLQFHSIRRRVLFFSLLLALLAVAAAVTVFCVSLYTYYYASMRSALTERARVSAETFTAFTAHSSEALGGRAADFARDFADKDVLELQFLNTKGEVVVSSSGFAGSSELDDTDVAAAFRSGGVECARFRCTATGESVMAATAPLYSPSGMLIGALRYVTGLKKVHSMLMHRFTMALTVGLAILGVVLLSGFYLSGTITQPIRSLTAMARKIAGGSYGAKVDKLYDDELGELTDTINDMSRKLGETEKLQTEFISSVSHELRTPLTAITGWSETMSYDDAIQGDSRRGLEIISREAARLTKMVEDLLEFTRIQDGRFTLQMGTLNLPELVEDTLYTYSELFRQAGIEVRYSPPDEDYPDIPGDAARLSQVLLNILDNACKYGKNGKTIEVALKMTATAQAVSVRDHGPGIPPEELPMVKTKFYKGSSRERGNGIGLAVCEEIVSRHNGKLTIYNAEGGGLLVTVTLPR